MLPEPLAPGLAPDVEGWVRRLTLPTERLDRLWTELERRRIGASDGVLEQRRAMAACDETYLLVARSAEALFRLGGEKELARRLRPKAKRQRKRPAAVQVAVSWWSAALAVFLQVRGFAVRCAQAMRRWADSRKAAGVASEERTSRHFRLARGCLKAPNV